LNILHVTPYYAPAWALGGVVRSVVGLAEAQADAGHAVAVLTTDILDRGGPSLPRREELGGVKVTRRSIASPWLRLSLNLSTPIGLARAAQEIIRRDGVQVVHLHEFRTTENMLVARQAISAGVPLVLSPHGTLPYETGRGWAKRAWDRVAGHRLARSVDQVIALTAVEAEQARRLWSRLAGKLDTDQIRVVPNGVRPAPPPRPDALAAFRHEWRLGSRTLAIFVGRLTARKGLDVLIDAFAHVASSHPQAMLLIVGPDGGELSGIRRRLQAQRMGDRVVLTGFLQGSALQTALAAADFFVLPATGEGMPMAALEALSSGLPIVTSPGCGLDMIEGSGAGFIVPPEVSRLSVALRQLFEQPDLRAKMGECAARLAMKHFAWPMIVPQVEAAYRSAIAHKGPASG
jgi:glycosyltransferase involved in cell wall biosynthesis